MVAGETGEELLEVGGEEVPVEAASPEVEVDEVTSVWFADEQLETARAAAISGAQMRTFIPFHCLVNNYSLNSKNYTSPTIGP